MENRSSSNNKQNKFNNKKLRRKVMVLLSKKYLNQLKNWQRNSYKKNFKDFRICKRKRKPKKNNQNKNNKHQYTNQKPNIQNIIKKQSDHKNQTKIQ